MKHLLKQQMVQLELKGFHMCGGLEYCFIRLRTQPRNMTHGNGSLIE